MANANANVLKTCYSKRLWSFASWVTTCEKSKRKHCIFIMSDASVFEMPLAAISKTLTAKQSWNLEWPMRSPAWCKTNRDELFNIATIWNLFSQQKCTVPVAVSFRISAFFRCAIKVPFCFLFSSLWGIEGRHIFRAIVKRIDRSGCSLFCGTHAS